MIPSKPLAQWCPGDPEQAHAFPSRYYYDAGVFQREVGAIFYPAWHFAGHRSEVSEPGDFIKVDVLDQSVLVVCGEDGVARAFHNVCQHRGTRLVEERRGQIERVIRCPYHAWAYRLDGRLRHAPRSEAVQGFDPGAVSLAPVRIEEVSSFLFVNFDPDATSLREEVGASAALMARHFPDLPDMELVDELDYEVAANWKVIAENAIEGYHFSLSGPVHKDLATLIRFDDYRLTPHDKWWAYMGPTEAGRKQAYGRDIGDAKYQTDWFVNIGFWPHTTLYTFPFTDFVGSFNQFPLGPRRPCCDSPTTVRRDRRAKSRRSACAGCPTTSAPRTSSSTSVSSGGCAPSATTADASSSTPTAATTASISCITSRVWSRKR